MNIDHQTFKNMNKGENETPAIASKWRPAIHPPTRIPAGFFFKNLFGDPAKTRARSIDLHRPSAAPGAERRGGRGWRQVRIDPTAFALTCGICWPPSTCCRRELKISRGQIVYLLDRCRRLIESLRPDLGCENGWSDLRRGPSISPIVPRLITVLILNVIRGPIGGALLNERLASSKSA